MMLCIQPCSRILIIDAYITDAYQTEQLRHTIHRDATYQRQYIRICLNGCLWRGQTVSWAHQQHPLCSHVHDQSIRAERQNSRSALNYIFFVNPAPRSAHAPSFSVTSAHRSAPAHPIFGPLRSQLRNSYSTLFGIVQYYSSWQHRRSSIQTSLFI